MGKTKKNTDGEDKTQEHANLFSRPMTKSGYKLDEVVSALQKAIRRGDEKKSLFFALELFPTFSKYAWKRLQVVSVEDIEDPMACVVVNSMRDAFMWNNEDKKSASLFQNRIFFTKAVLYLCRAKKSREADHAQHFIDQKIRKGAICKIPDYAFDCHTQEGRDMGKTKSQFFEEEQEGLNDKGRDEYYTQLDKDELKNHFTKK